MKAFKGISGAIAAMIAMFALSAPASALTITFDDIVTGDIPNSPAPYLTATITNVAGGGVNITLTAGVLSPEFLTRMKFSLTGNYTLSDPTTVPDISLESCGNSQSPASTGPWQMCLSFAPSVHWNADGSVTFFMAGLSESNFVYNSDSWRAVAHVQGIGEDCSAWVGDYAGTGGIRPSNSGPCGGETSVPEPGTLSLLGLGLFGMAAGMRRRRKLH